MDSEVLWIVPPVVLAVGFALAAFGRSASAAQRADARLQARLTEIDQKLDAVIKHLGVQLPDPQQQALERHPDLLPLLREGKKIQAIKVYRESSGAGLREAKDVVEALARRYGL